MIASVPRFDDFHNFSFHPFHVVSWAQRQFKVRRSPKWGCVLLSAKIVKIPTRTPRSGVREVKQLDNEYQVVFAHLAGHCRAPS